MALTNFAALTSEQKQVWARDTWRQARDKSFISRFTGTSQNSMIHRVTELTKNERGHQAVVTLVPDATGDGYTGDTPITNEEALTAYDFTVPVDQLRFAHKNTGRLADQKTIVNFRTVARDQLSYTLGDRMDQMAFLLMAGVDLGNRNDNVVASNDSRTGTPWAGLAFQATGPTDERVVSLKAGGAIADGAADADATIGYRHIVKLQAEARLRYLRGIRGDAGSEVYHLFLHPSAMAQLKLDDDFLKNSREAGVRGKSNHLWAGGQSFMVDGLLIHEFRHVPFSKTGVFESATGATNSSCRGLLCGAQALALIDLGAGQWDERDHFDYGNNYGIAYGKLFGMAKPFFNGAKAAATGTQDYGVIAVDMRC